MARIMVVDDEEPIRTLIRRALEGAGHDVLEARDGRQALRLLDGAQMNLVINDIMMPEKDGLEVITALRRSSPQTRVIAITGGGILKARALHMASLLGAYSTLLKPFSLETLIEQVQAALAA